MANLSERVETQATTMVSGFKDTGIHYVISNNPQQFLTVKGETKMGIRTVNLTLIDNDTNLKGAEKIVFQSQVVTEHDNDKTIQQVLITGEVAKALAEHNEKRSGTVDKAVLRSTGTKVYLEPVEIFELQWQVVQVG